MRPTGFCGPSVPPRPVAPSGRRRPVKMQRKACAAAAGRIREPRRRPSLRRSASPPSPLQGGRCEPAHCPAMIGLCGCLPAHACGCPVCALGRFAGREGGARYGECSLTQNHAGVRRRPLGSDPGSRRSGEVMCVPVPLRSHRTASPRLVRRRLAFDQISAPGTARTVTKAPLEGPCGTGAPCPRPESASRTGTRTRASTPGDGGCPGVPCMRTGVLLSACNPPACSRWLRVAYGG